MEPIPLFNQSALRIQNCGPKGRGVVTTTLIPARATIDISPILLFPSEEYSLHGQYTQLDHYTYRWQGGMALALGLGSMFNHSNKPNVGFQRDFVNKMIRYSALRDIQAGEELCISYGPNLWFPDMEEDEQEQAEGHDADGAGNWSGTDGEDETGDALLSRLQFSDVEDVNSAHEC